MNTDEVIHVREDGYFDLVKYIDHDYPGIDVEFVPIKSFSGTYPRVLFEFPATGKLRVLIWGDKEKEDYTHCFEFDI